MDNTMSNIRNMAEENEMTTKERITQVVAPVRIARFTVGNFSAVRGSNPEVELTTASGKKWGTLYPANGEGWNVASAKRDGNWAAGMRCFASLDEAIAWIESIPAR